MNNFDLSLIVEVVLALGSFIFYKIMKLIIGNIYTLYLTFNKKRASQWQILSGDNINKFLSLPVLMTKAPRWNTHAIIGTLGPIQVQKTLTLNLATIRQSAPSWVGCLYSFPSYQTVASFDSSDYENQTSNELNLELSPGKYTVGLRYYNYSGQITYPEVIVDNNTTIASQPISADTNDFYRHLSKRQNLFYLGLHYYIFTLFKLRHWFPESFVKNEFLPVGATDTEFFYGCLNQDQQLQLDLDSEIIAQNYIYLTIYNRASFPISWCQVKEAKTLTEPMPNHGYYLIRVRAQNSQSQGQVTGQEQQVSKFCKQLNLKINNI